MTTHPTLSPPSLSPHQLRSLLCLQRHIRGYLLRKHLITNIRLEYEKIAKNIDSKILKNNIKNWYHINYAHTNKETKLMDHFTYSYTSKSNINNDHDILLSHLPHSSITESNTSHINLDHLLGVPMPSSSDSLIQYPNTKILCKPIIIEKASLSTPSLSTPFLSTSSSFSDLSPYLPSPKKEQSPPLSLSPHHPISPSLSLSNSSASPVSLPPSVSLSVSPPLSPSVSPSEIDTFTVTDPKLHSQTFYLPNKSHSNLTSSPLIFTPSPYRNEDPLSLSPSPSNPSISLSNQAPLSPSPSKNRSSISPSLSPSDSPIILKSSNISHTPNPFLSHPSLYTSSLYTSSLYTSSLSNPSLSNPSLSKDLSLSDTDLDTSVDSDIDAPSISHPSLYASSLSISSLFPSKKHLHPPSNIEPISPSKAPISPSKTPLSPSKLSLSNSLSQSPNRFHKNSTTSLSPHISSLSLSPSFSTQIVHSLSSYSPLQNQKKKQTASFSPSLPHPVSLSDSSSLSNPSLSNRFDVSLDPFHYHSSSLSKKRSLSPSSPISPSNTHRKYHHTLESSLSLSPSLSLSNASPILPRTLSRYIDKASLPPSPLSASVSLSTFNNTAKSLNFFDLDNENIRQNDRNNRDDMDRGSNRDIYIESSGERDMQTNRWMDKEIDREEIDDDDSLNASLNTLERAIKARLETIRKTENP
jgi:hypothetical protein